MISLTEIKSLIDELNKKDNDVIDAENNLKKVKEEARRYREDIIPCALQELGVTKLVLESGETITLSQEVYASIPSQKKRYAFEWLVDNGFSGLIKVEVTTAFSKGEYQKAYALNEELHGKGVNSNLSQSVHPQTLKAFLKEQINKGSGVPLELFGASPVFKVNIKK